MTTARPIGRRRVLRILAVAAALPFVSGAGASVYEWRGQALGAQARLRLVHGDGAKVRWAVAACLDEIKRLERVFSLFDPASELSRLNRDGRLAGASHDLRLVLAEATRMSLASGGAFDVTVQPLWRAMARHFAAHPGAAPDRRVVDAALARVDFHQLDIDGAAVGFRQPGMAVTLNGIAQGYITDRVAELLRDMGFERVLVEAGEIYALSAAADSPPWTVALAGTGRRLRLADSAVATSSGPAIVFEPSGAHHHLLDPRTGASPAHYASVSVVAGTALRADALSTALSLLPLDAAASLLAAAGRARAIFALADGGLREIRA